MQLDPIARVCVKQAVLGRARRGAERVFVPDVLAQRRELGKCAIDQLAPIRRGGQIAPPLQTAQVNHAGFHLRVGHVASQTGSTRRAWHGHARGCHSQAGTGA